MAIVTKSTPRKKTNINSHYHSGLSTMHKQVGAKQQDLFILYLHVCMCRCVQVIANARRGYQRVSSFGAGVTGGFQEPSAFDC